MEKIRSCREKRSMYWNLPKFDLRETKFVLASHAPRQKQNVSVASEADTASRSVDTDMIESNNKNNCIFVDVSTRLPS